MKREQEAEELKTMIKSSARIVRRGKKVITSIYEDSTTEGSIEWMRIRLLVIATQLLEGSILLTKARSMFGLELTMRPIVEIYINFFWINTPQDEKNYELLVTDDCIMMHKNATRLANWSEKYGKAKTADFYREIAELNLSQAKDIWATSDVTKAGDKPPALYMRAKEIDARKGVESTGEFEFVVQMLYSIGHNAVHTTNRQLNRLDETNATTLFNIDDLPLYTHLLGRINELYLEMLEGLCESLDLKSGTDKLWDFSPAPVKKE